MPGLESVKVATGAEKVSYWRVVRLIPWTLRERAMMGGTMAEVEGTAVPPVVLSRMTVTVKVPALDQVWLPETV